MKVLFFGIQYHGYTDAIIDEMRRLGAAVTFVDLQPRSLPFKVLRTVARPFYEGHVQRHLVAAVEAERVTAYDKVVFLQAHQMPVETLATLRRLQPQAEFVLYNWDAITTHDYRPQAKLFHRVLTFDRRDAETQGYQYLPLFCIRKWQGLADRAHPRSVYMVGNIVRLARYHAVRLFAAYCADHGIAFRTHLKISPVVLAQALRSGIWPRDVTLQPIPEARFIDLAESSAAAFDFANHTQSGQTMRMMESLCMGKKVITNNAFVMLEPFYSPDRVYVFDGSDFSGVAQFLDTPLADPGATYPEYRVQAFTRRLLGLDETAR